MPRLPHEKGIQRDTSISEALHGVATKVYKSAYDASGQLGLSKATLYRRQSGGQSRAEVRESQQLMTNAEESALAHWLTELTE
jgi:hypothetical protein